MTKNFFSVLLVFSLVACGKLSTSPETTVAVIPIPVSPTKVVPVLPKKDTITCGSQAAFLDIVSASFSIKLNGDGSSVVSCSVTDTSGRKTSQNTTYDLGYGTHGVTGEDPAFAYFSFCKMVYHDLNGDAHNFQFYVPGNYNPNQSMLDPSVLGWEIMSQDAHPFNDISFAGSNCD